jgi:hypothetical protein
MKRWKTTPDLFFPPDCTDSSSFSLYFASRPRFFFPHNKSEGRLFFFPLPAHVVRHLQP